MFQYDFVIECQPVGTKGFVILTAKRCGVVVFINKLDLHRSVARRDFAEAVASKDPKIRPEEVEAKLLELTANLNDDLNRDEGDVPIDFSPDDGVVTLRVGDRDPLTGKFILDPADPLPSARVFLRERYSIDEVIILRHYADVFRVWRNNHHAPLEIKKLRRDLYHFAEQAVRPGSSENGEVIFDPFQPTSAKVSNLVDALSAETHLPVDIAPPQWLTHDPALPPVDELIICASGNLHIPTRQWLPATPTLFSTYALNFDYDPQAPQPVQWLEFLDQLWPNDPESIGALQEWFGYCLTGDTALQKMFMLVGPKRSGKGTIGRVQAALVGRDNVAGPTTSSLATQFGLQPLIGKPLAIVSDARFSGQPDSAIVLERLLCISGEDALTIDRKYLPSVTLRLPTRFMFLTNELPRIADASGALAGRFIILLLRRTFFGEEDTTLTERLLTELPGIMLWALEGLDRLRARGRFLMPESSREAVQELVDLASPVAAFLRDCCFIAPGTEVDAKQLYAAWKNWCVDHGRDRPGTEQTFGRDLRAAVPGLTTRQPRSGVTRWRSYVGIGLKAQWHAVERDP